MLLKARKFIFVTAKLITKLRGSLFEQIFNCKITNLYYNQQGFRLEQTVSKDKLNSLQAINFI